VGLGLLAVLAAGCGTPVGTHIPIETSRAAGPPHEYRLGPGDRVALTVFGQADLSTAATVSPTGKLAFPLIGDIPAGGRTLDQVQDTTRQILASGLLVNPRLSMEIVTYRPFYITGEVARPGSYPFVPGLDIRQAIAIAGGPTRRANSASFMVTRGTGADRVAEVLDLDSPVEPDDTIDVGRRWF
jgi:polysaccharide export outer membrane protein